MHHKIESDGRLPAATGRIYRFDPPLNYVRQARAIALVRIAEPPQQKQDLVPQSPLGGDFGRYAPNIVNQST